MIWACSSIHLWTYFPQMPCYIHFLFIMYMYTPRPRPKHLTCLQGTKRAVVLAFSLLLLNLLFLYPRIAFPKIPCKYSELNSEQQVFSSQIYSGLSLPLNGYSEQTWIEYWPFPLNPAQSSVNYSIFNEGLPSKNIFYLIFVCCIALLSFWLAVLCSYAYVTTHAFNQHWLSFIRTWNDTHSISTDFNTC